MISAAAFVPATPLLVPAVAQGAAGELDVLRAACRDAVALLARSGCDEVVVVGAAPRTGWCAPDAVGDLRGLALEVEVALVPGRTGPRELSRGLLLGTWLLDELAPGLPRRALAAGTSDAPADLAAEGEALALSDAALGLLVVGDGSAAQVLASPLAERPGAAEADREAAAALGAADLAVIASWAAGWGEGFGIEGRAPWQLAAGAAAGARWRATTAYDDAPYGVTYLVVAWERV